MISTEQFLKQLFFLRKELLKYHFVQTRNIACKTIGIFILADLGYDP